MNAMHSLTWPGPRSTGAGSWNTSSVPMARREPASGAWTPRSPAGRLLSSLLNHPSLLVGHACAVSLSKVFQEDGT